MQSAGTTASATPGAAPAQSAGAPASCASRPTTSTPGATPSPPALRGALERVSWLLQHAAPQQHRPRTVSAHTHTAQRQGRARSWVPWTRCCPGSRRNRRAACRTDPAQGGGYVAGVVGASNVTQQWQCQPSQASCTLSQVDTCSAASLRASLQCPSGACNATQVCCLPPHPPPLASAGDQPPSSARQPPALPVNFAAPVFPTLPEALSGAMSSSHGVPCMFRPPAHDQHYPAEVMSCLQQRPRGPLDASVAICLPVTLRPWFADQRGRRRDHH